MEALGRLLLRCRSPAVIPCGSLHRGVPGEVRVLRLLGDIASCTVPPDLESAEGHYNQALARADELGMRPLAAHCHLGLGKFVPPHRSSGKGRRAPDHRSRDVPRDGHGLLAGEGGGGTRFAP